MRIENDLYCVHVDPKNGAIRRIFDKVGKLDLVVEPRLADNFRILLPLPDRQANYILGKDQRLTGADESATGLTLRWDGPLTHPQYFSPKGTWIMKRSLAQAQAG